MVIVLLAKLEDFVPSHWSVVLLIAAVFFALQISLCCSFYFRAWKQQRTLRGLYDQLQAGRDGRGDSEARAAHFSWLAWVNRMFPAGTSTPGNYTRDDVLQELDTRIASSSDYLLLQRMGVMAPLLGVILTVLGFAWLEVPESAEQSLDDILFAVTPLVAGVGAGAILAFINQGLLHVAGNKSEALRMAARTWFDAAIWSSVGLDTQAATVKAIHAIERMAESVAQSADRQNENSRLLAEATSAICEAGDSLRQSVSDFGGELQDLPETLAGLQQATGATAESLRELIPVGQRAVAGLDVSVAAFRSAIDSEFVAAARLHRSVMNEMTEAVTGIRQAAEGLQSGSDDLQTNVQAHGQSIASLNDSLQTRILPSHGKLESTVVALNAQMDTFRNLVESLAQNAETVALEFGKVAGQLEPSVTTFRNTVDGQFAIAAELHQESSESLALGAERIQQAAEVLADGAGQVQQLLQQQVEVSAQVGPAQDSLLDAMHKISAAAQALQQSVDGGVAQSHPTLHGATVSLADSSDRLTAFIERLDPATRRLGELDQTLATLQPTVEALQQFSHMHPEIERLSGALAQAATVADAIAELPNQIRDILEKLVAQQHVKGNSRANPMTWLRGR